MLSSTGDPEEGWLASGRNNRFMGIAVIIRWCHRQVNFLASPRLAVGLLSVLIGLLVAHLLIPQIDSADQQILQQSPETTGGVGWVARVLGLTNVQRSWLLYGTYGLLFVNLVLYMKRRIPSTIQHCRFPRKPPAVSSDWLHRQVPSTGLPLGDVTALLRRHGYHTLVEENTVYGLRGRLAILGHWLLHLSFLMLLAGGMWVAAGPQAFRGTVGVGEGESFDLHTSPFLTANGSPSARLPELRFTLEKLAVQTEGDEVREFQASVLPPEGRAVTVGINQPYRQKPYQALAQGFGYMPGWVVARRHGPMLAGAWVKLMPFPHLEEETFPIGPDESRVTVRLFPDFEAANEGIRTASYHLRNPRFDTRVVWRGQPVFTGLLEPDQPVPLGEGLEFRFLPEIRRYGMLDIMQERGHQIIFVGLGCMVLGILFRYGRIRQEVVARLGDRSLELYGRSEILMNLFAEDFARLAAELSVASSPRRGLGSTR